jgi:Flp pilus assembly protein TadD
MALRFTPDSRTLRVVSGDGEVAAWPVPDPAPSDDPRALRLWVEATSGLRQAEDRTIASLGPGEWQSASERVRSEVPALPGALAVAISLEAWHRARVADADQLGLDVALRWHLACLASLRPDDWTILVRRAATFSSRGERNRAAAEYDRAAKLAPPGSLVNWYWSQAMRCLDEKQEATALWYLDRVVAARPDDWRVHAHRADLLRQLNRDEKAAREESLVVHGQPDAMAVNDLLMMAAVRGEWPRAAALADAAAARGGLDWASYAQSLLRAGDVAGYRKACTELLRHLGPKPWLSDLLAAVWTCALGPGTRADLARPTALIDDISARLIAIKDKNDYVQALTYSALMCKAALSLRADLPDEAFDRWQRAIQLHSPDRNDHLLLALIQSRRGQPALAQRSLHEALDGFDAQAEADPRTWQGQWRARAEFEILRAEASAAVLDAAFPAEAPFASGGGM